jgi:hypothetical protein
VPQVIISSKLSLSSQNFSRELKSRRQIRDKIKIKPQALTYKSFLEKKACTISAPQ